MNQHGQLMPTTSLPSVSPVPVSSQSDLGPINPSLNCGDCGGNNGGNGYHMSHHIQQHQTHQTNASASATYHNSPHIDQAQQSSNQEVPNYSNTVTPVSMPSPPESIPPHQSS